MLIANCLHKNKEKEFAILDMLRNGPFWNDCSQLGSQKNFNMSQLYYSFLLFYKFLSNKKSNDFAIRKQSRAVVLQWIVHHFDRVPTSLPQLVPTYSGSPINTPAHFLHRLYVLIYRTTKPGGCFRK